MIKKVYLLWHTYVTDELLTIGSLTKEENKYIFKYDDEVLKAINCRCMIPFPYTTEEIHFSSLPQFFLQRMLSIEMLKKMNVDFNPNDELDILTINNSKRNNDNFYVVKESMYNLIKEENAKVMK